MTNTSGLKRWPTTTIADLKTMRQFLSVHPLACNTVSGTPPYGEHDLYKTHAGCTFSLFGSPCAAVSEPHMMPETSDEPLSDVV